MVDSLVNPIFEAYRLDVITSHYEVFVVVGEIVSFLMVFCLDMAIYYYSSSDSSITVFSITTTIVPVFVAGSSSNTIEHATTIASIRCTLDFILETNSSLYICLRNSFFYTLENDCCMDVYCGICVMACTGEGHALNTKLCTTKSEDYLIVSTITYCFDYLVHLSVPIFSLLILVHYRETIRRNVYLYKSITWRTFPLFP